MIKLYNTANTVHREAIGTTLCAFTQKWYNSYDQQLFASLTISYSIANNAYTVAATVPNHPRISISVTKLHTLDAALSISPVAQ